MDLEVQENKDIYNRDSNSKRIEIPIWHKLALTLEEAAAYSNIGINKLREISNSEKCPFVLWMGNKRLIKRAPFDEWIRKEFSI